MVENHYGADSQPVAVFGGDFNIKPLEWVQCLQNVMHTQASRHTVQICTSRTIPLHHGDRALVFNAFAVQEDSGWGKSHRDDKKNRSRSRMDMTPCLFLFVGITCAQLAVLHGLLSHHWLLRLTQIHSRTTHQHPLRSLSMSRNRSQYRKCLLKPTREAALNGLRRLHLRLTLQRSRRSSRRFANY